MSIAPSLTLWVPGLLHPQRIEEAGDELNNQSFPALQKLLSKADYHFNKPRTFEAQASFLFHQPNTLPSAATRASVLAQETFNHTNSDFWLSVDPVQMIPDRDTLVLIPGKDLAITEHESKALLTSFNEHFAQDQVELIFGSPDQWFMTIKQPIDLQSTPLEQVAYQNIGDAFPQGNAANYWHQLINETQMLFYLHPVNEKRREKGFPEINSIWPWGEGDLSSDINSRPDAVIHSSHPYLQGLAKLTHAQLNSSTKSFGDWQASQAKGHSLLYLDNLAEIIPNMQLAEWLEALQAIENDWAKPILQALGKGELSSLYLDLGANKQFYITPRHLKRFWRWKKGWLALSR